jgi:hypothetical protein
VDLKAEKRGFRPAGNDLETFSEPAVSLVDFFPHVLPVKTTLRANGRVPFLRMYRRRGNSPQEDSVVISDLKRALPLL